MFRYLLILAILTSLIGCGGTAPANNSNTNNSNTNSTTSTPPVLDSVNMPSNSQVPANSPPSTPITTMNGANVTKGTTPTPGIPSQAEHKKPFKPGTTPTPGIPSAEEIRKALGQPNTNVNSPGPAMMKDVPMMKSNKKVGGKPN